MICDFITRNKIFTRDDPLPREKKNKNYGGGRQWQVITECTKQK